MTFCTVLYDVSTCRLCISHTIKKLLYFLKCFLDKNVFFLSLSLLLLDIFLFLSFYSPNSVSSYSEQQKKRTHQVSPIQFSSALFILHWCDSRASRHSSEKKARTQDRFNEVQNIKKMGKRATKLALCCNINGDVIMRILKSIKHFAYTFSGFASDHTSLSGLPLLHIIHTMSKKKHKKTLSVACNLCYLAKTIKYILFSVWNGQRTSKKRIHTTTLSAKKLNQELARRRARYKTKRYLIHFTHKHKSHRNQCNLKTKWSERTTKAARMAEWKKRTATLNK